MEYAYVILGLDVVFDNFVVSTVGVCQEYDRHSQSVVWNTFEGKDYFEAKKRALEWVCGFDDELYEVCRKRWFNVDKLPERK